MVSDPAEMPPDLKSSIAEQATRDAEAVILLLRLTGLAPSPGETRSFPANFLLELGASTRLRTWEQEGIAIHLEAGLPTAREALFAAFRGLAGLPRDGAVEDLSTRILRLASERLAWAGHRDLCAEVILDDPAEDALVEAVAKVLWENRRRRAGEREVGRS